MWYVLLSDVISSLRLLMFVGDIFRHTCLLIIKSCDAIVQSKLCECCTCIIIIIVIINVNITNLQTN